MFFTVEKETKVNVKEMKPSSDKPREKSNKGIIVKNASKNYVLRFSPMESFIITHYLRIQNAQFLPEV